MFRFSCFITAPLAVALLCAGTVHAADSGAGPPTTPAATNIPSGPLVTQPLNVPDRPAGVALPTDAARSPVGDARLGATEVDARKPARDARSAPVDSRLVPGDVGRATTIPAPGPGIADDYKIGPQDLLEIQVYGLEGLRRDVRVNSKGVITLPLVGSVTVGGLTSQEAEEVIRLAYEKDYLRNPQVSLFIKEYTSQRITVEGAVNRPGVYPIKGQTSLLQAIAIAGGQGQLSDMTQVLLFRSAQGEKKTIKYDVTKIRSGEVQDPILVNEDVVVVNRNGARAALRDSLFRDIIDTINPFSYIRPVP